MRHLKSFLTNKKSLFAFLIIFFNEIKLVLRKFVMRNSFSKINRNLELA